MQPITSACLHAPGGALNKIPAFPSYLHNDSRFFVYTSISKHSWSNMHSSGCKAESCTSTVKWLYWNFLKIFNSFRERLGEKHLSFFYIPLEGFLTLLGIEDQRQLELLSTFGGSQSFPLFFVLQQNWGLSFAQVFQLSHRSSSCHPLRFFPQSLGQFSSISILLAMASLNT